MKLAIIHDDITQWGGAERILAKMHEIWPNAPIFTTVANQKIAKNYFPKAEIHASFLQKLPFSQKYPKLYFFLHPIAFESFDFSDFDVVLSSSSRFAKGVITQPSTIHITYCHTAPRFLWKFETTDPRSYIRQFYFLPYPFIKLLQRWDYYSSARPDIFLANSRNVSARLKKIYQKESEVVYPFVERKRFVLAAKKKDFVLVVSRLVRWKRIDLAIKAAKEAKLNLVIVGTGPDMARLESIAGPSVRFLTNLTDRKVSELMSRASALLICHEEDFGMVAIEAQAAGTPVVVFEKSGAAETVVKGKTGVIFSSQKVEEIKEALLQVKRMRLKPADCRENAQRFGEDSFVKKLSDIVEMSYNTRKR